MKHNDQHAQYRYCREGVMKSVKQQFAVIVVKYAL